ncbi:ArnT family glycosyltransferase [Candidatus Omnitrophota bacterium]
MLLFSFHGINNWMVLKHDTRLLGDDENGYFRGALTAKQDIVYLAKGEVSFKQYVNLFCAHFEARPPLYHILVGICFIPFSNPSFDFAVMHNLLFLLILMFAMVGIGKYLSDVKFGVFLAFITTMIPGVFAFSRLMMPAFFLLTLVALSFYFLLLTDNFLKTKYAVCLGIIMGLGILTKSTYPAFLLAPMVWSIYTGIKRSRIDKIYPLQIYMNVGLSLFCASVIAALWYVPYWSSYFERMTKQVFLDATGSLYEKTHYLMAFVFQQLLPFYWILFLFAVVVLIWKKKVLFLVRMLFFIIIPICIIDYAVAQESRFTIAVLPFAAIIIARGIALFKNKLVIICVIIISFLQYFSLSYSTHSSFMPRNQLIFSKITNGLTWALHDTGIFSPNKEDWQPYEDAYALIEEHYLNVGKEVPKIYVLDPTKIRAENLWYLAFRNNVRLHLINLGISKKFEHVMNSRGDALVFSFKDNFKNRKLDLWVYEYPLVYAQGQKGKRAFFSRIDDYTLLAELDLKSEQGIIQVYKKKEPLVE